MLFHPLRGQVLVRHWVLLPCVLLILLGCRGTHGRVAENDDFEEQEHDWSRVELDPEFESYLRPRLGLEHGGTAFVSGNDGQVFMIAVGITENRAFEDSSPMARVETIRVAEIQARREAVRYFESEISGELRIHSSESTTMEGADGEREVTTVTMESINDWTIERVEGFVREARVIGYWYSTDRQLLFCAIAIPIE